MHEKQGITQQNAPFVAETTRPTTKDANAITILSAVEFHIEIPFLQTQRSPRWKLHNAPPFIPPPHKPNNRAPMRMLSITEHTSQMTQSPHLPLSLENLKTSSLSSYIKIA